MELGIHFIDFLPGDAAQLAPALLSTATAAEDIGATMFTLADHFFQMESVGRAEDPFLEGYTSLGYLAGRACRCGQEAQATRGFECSPGSTGGNESL